MSTVIAPSPTGVGDMFLMVKGAKCGLIKGEAQDDVHKGEIEVLRWSWGMQAKPSLGGGVVNTANARPRARTVCRSSGGVRGSDRLNATKRSLVEANGMCAGEHALARRA